MDSLRRLPVALPASEVRCRRLSAGIWTGVPRFAIMETMSEEGAERDTDEIFGAENIVRLIREEAQPLIPRYSLRWMLGLTTACAFLFAVFGMAARGHAWAICVSAGVGSLVLIAMIHALLYGCLSALTSLTCSRAGTSPFQSAPAVSTANTRKKSASDNENPFEAEIVP